MGVVSMQPLAIILLSFLSFCLISAHTHRVRKKRRTPIFSSSKATKIHARIGWSHTSNIFFLTCLTLSVKTQNKTSKSINKTFGESYLVCKLVNRNSSPSWQKGTSETLLWFTEGHYCILCVQSPVKVRDAPRGLGYDTHVSALPAKVTSFSPKWD